MRIFNCYNCYKCPILSVLILKVIIEKNDVYSLSQFSVWSAKVNQFHLLQIRFLSIGGKKKEMELCVAVSVARARVSKLPYLNAILVAKHHL